MAVPNPQNNVRATSYPRDNNRPDEWVQYVRIFNVNFGH